MFKKILVPLDGSKLAESALSCIKILAEGGKVGEVILLTVARIDIPYDEIPADFNFHAMREQILDKFRKYLARIQSRLSKRDIKVKTMIVESNNSAQSIIDVAEKNGADLIVMTTHGYTGFKKMLIGSVAFKVLHESNVAVLLSRAKKA